MTSFIRVPPDSTGKRIRHRNITDIYVGAETNIPELQTIVYGSLSGASGTIAGRSLHTPREYFIANVTGTFQVSDVISSGPVGSGTVYATATEVVVDVHTAKNVIADQNNPDNALSIDRQGQASVRFAEGSPTMDVFGNLRIAEGRILGGYEYSANDQADLFQDLTTTGGSLSWAAGTAQTVMSVNNSATASVSRTTNRWHFYQPGVGQLSLLTLHLNDNGKLNNTRRWGYYGGTNGVYFEVAGTTLNVVKRSKTTGTMVETRIPRSQWNGDKLDGTGISGMNIDLTKANLFWIDLAWLGVGAVRMGVYAEDGQRWVCHTFKNPNNNIGPYMARGSLPIRYENFNTSGTSGTSEITLICAAVYAEAVTDYVTWRYSDIERDTPVTVTTNTHILSMKPKLEMAAGFPNRTGLYPETLNVFVTGGNVKITILDDAALSAPTWTNATGTATFDISNSTVTGGEKFRSFYLGAGSHNIDLSKFYELNDEGYHTLADSTDAYSFTVAATKLDGTTVQVAATLGYRELN